MRKLLYNIAKFTVNMISFVLITTNGPYIFGDFGVSKMPKFCNFRENLIKFLFKRSFSGCTTVFQLGFLRLELFF